MKRKIISVILTLSMGLSMLPVTVWASEADPDTGLCPHHTEHTEECGYIPASGGAPCAYERTDDSYTVGMDCIHIHDESCGYAAPVEGVPCGYVCGICNGAAEVQALIDALPAVGEVRAMDPDGQRTVYSQTQNAYTAYQELTEEQQAQITGLDNIYALFDLFNGQTATLATASVPYRNGNGGTSTVTATVLEAGTNAWTEGWYVANSNVTITERVTATGMVNLILADGCTLTIPLGISVQNNGNGLVVYGQSGGTGKMIVNSKGAAIDCGSGGGTLVVYGGTVQASGAYLCAAIGSSTGASQNNQQFLISINGGHVIARGGGGGDAEGIGSGNGSGVSVKAVINGGIVEASGSTSYGANGGIHRGFNMAGGILISNFADGLPTQDEYRSGGLILDTKSGNGAMYSNATMDYALTFPANTNLDLNGKTLTCNAVLTNNGNITGSGTIDIANGTLFDNGAIASTVTITPKNTTYTVTAPTENPGLTYTGSSQPLVNAGSVTASSGARIEYSLDDANYSSSIPTATDAGSYKVYYKVANFGKGYFKGPYSGTINVAIAKADRALNITNTPGTVTYGDSPFTLSTSGGSDTGSVSWSIPNSALRSYATIDSSSGIVTVLKATSTTITVTANKRSDTNYNEATATWEFTINKATPAYTVPSGLTVQYGQTLADVTLPDRWEWDNENTSVGDVGPRSFPATFTPEDTGNYNTVNTNVPVTVLKSDSTVTATDTVNITYGDILSLSAEVRLATFAIGDNNDKVEFYLGGTKLGESTVSKSGGTAALNTQVAASKGFQIGDNTVRAVYNGGLNLNGSEKNAITVKVSKKELSISGAKAAERIYEPGNTQVEITGGTLVGVVDSEDVRLVGAGATGKIASADVGMRKSVTVTGYTLDGGDKDHYTLKQPADVTVNITQATPDVDPPTAIEGLVYNGESQQLVKAGSTTAGTAMQYSTDGRNYSPTVPAGTAAKVYTVYYKVVGNNNYKDVDAAGPITVTIAEADQPAPVVATDYTAETLETAASMEYSKTGTDNSWTRCGDHMPVTAEGFGWDGTEDVTVYFRYAADENHNPGAVRTLLIHARPDAPTGIAVKKARTSVILTCTDAEFAKDTPANWQGGTFNGLDPEETYTFYVRTKATTEAFASQNAEVTVTTVREDGSTILQPGETVEAGNGGRITNNGDNIAMEDGDGDDSTTVTPAPSGGAVIDEDGNVTVPGGSTVRPGNGGPNITVNDEATVDRDGNVTFPEGGSARVNGDTVTVPENDGTLKPDGKGGVEVPGGSTVTPPGGPDITLPGGGTVNPDGSITPEGGSVQMSDTTVTVPEDGGTLKPDGKGGVEVPGGSAVTPPGGPDITVGPGNSGVVDQDGNVTLPGEGSAKIKDTTVTVPEAGGTLTPNGDGTVNVPPGSKVRDKDGKERTVPSQGGKINSEGVYEDNPSPSGGGGSSASFSTYPPVIPKAKGGKVSVFPSSPRWGNAVTITPTPDESYEVENVSVKDSRGNVLRIKDNGNGTFSYTQPIGNVTIEVTFKAVSVPPADGPNFPALAFSDLDPNAWYWEAVNYVVGNGLMNGYGNGIFGPDDALSRAMLAQILYNAAGGVPVNYLMEYDDIPTDEWYAEAVRWAASESIISGYGNGQFGPDDPITREQLAAMLYRYEQSKVGVTEAWTPQLSYNDITEVSDWAYDAIGWCTTNGIIEGKGNGILGPKDKATRAEAAAMLTRFLSRLFGK